MNQKRGRFILAKQNKKGEFGFVWLFAIIAGVAILLLAIYGAIKIGGTIQVIDDAQIAKQFTIITDPFEAGFTDATTGTISFKQKVILRNTCSDIGFGKNSLSVKSESNVGQKYQDVSVETSINEKYVFGPEEQTGYDFFILSKSFEFPYKVSDYVLILSDEKKYCFNAAPQNIRNEIEDLNVPVISFNNCTRNNDYIQVCFNDNNCDINVIGNCENCNNFYDSGIVRFSNGKTVEYVDNLVYPAIFSTPSIYECNVNRLLHRAGTIAKVLSTKSALMNSRECNTNLENDLLVWSSALQNATYLDLLNYYPDSINLDDRESLEVCGVW